MEKNMKNKKIETSKEANMKYQIRVEGQLNSHWTQWFEGMTINYDGDTTVLTGSVADQSALHGLLHRIRDLNLTLISLNKLDYQKKDKIDKEEKS
jgi:hypothetical protein